MPLNDVWEPGVLMRFWLMVVILLCLDNGGLSKYEVFMLVNRWFKMLMLEDVNEFVGV